MISHLMKKLKKRLRSFLGIDEAMILLVVKESGLMLSPPGMKPFRTPAEVNITKCDINVITTYLRSQGVEKYKILSGDEVLKFKSKKQSKPEPKKEKVDISKRLDVIEDLIKDLKNIPPPESKTKIVYKEIEERDEFIPSIDTGDMKLSGKSIQRQEGDDISNNVEKLKRLKE